MQAKDKDHWVRLFSHFCSKTANEEEEIVHKLLGDKFKVGFLPCPLFPTPQVVWATFKGTNSTSGLFSATVGVKTSS